MAVHHAFLFTGLDVLLMAAVGFLLLVAAVAARLLIRATTPHVPALLDLDLDLDLELVEARPADEPVEQAAAG